jgi:excisionase family DNA binding protein
MAKRRVNPEAKVQPLPENLLDINGVAKHLRVSRDKIFELMKYGGLPYIKWGARTLRFDPNKVAQWLDDQSA